MSTLAVHCQWKDLIREKYVQLFSCVKVKQTEVASTSYPWLSHRVDSGNHSSPYMLLLSVLHFIFKCLLYVVIFFSVIRSFVLWPREISQLCSSSDAAEGGRQPIPECWVMWPVQRQNSRDALRKSAAALQSDRLVWWNEDTRRALQPVGEEKLLEMWRVGVSLALVPDYYVHLL